MNQLCPSSRIEVNALAARALDHRLQNLTRAAASPIASESVLAPLLAGLELLAQGVALLDSDGRLRYANAASRELLERAGWTVHDGRPCAPDLDLHSSWLAAVRMVCTSARWQLFDLSGRGGGCFAALLPVEVDSGRLAFLTFGRAAICGALELQMFASEHDLTYAESRVLEKLAAGMTPAEIAQCHGVAQSTVLTQVAAVRSKTLSHSIKEVVGKLSRLPPMRSVFSPPDPLTVPRQ